MGAGAEVVIIGGGIIGTSVAYHLALRGCTDVILLEREFIGYGATGRSAGMIMHQTGLEPTTPLAQLSIRAYRALNGQSGPGSIGLHQTGSILFATDDEAAERLRAQIQMQNRLGIETGMLTGAELREALPSFVKSDHILVASYCADDGYIDPYLASLEFADQARDKGVQTRLHKGALRIVSDGDRITGVQTEDGLIETRVVVNAAGSLAREVAAWVGINLPIEHHVRNIAVFTPRRLVEQFPIVEDIVTEFYFRPDGPNVLVGVGPETVVDDPPKTLAPDYDHRHDEALFDFLSERAPELTEVPWRGGWAGVRALTPDRLPILGPVDDIHGLFNCCGFSGFGITLAPVIGRVTADLVIDGATKEIDIEPFLLRRFPAA